MLSNGQIWVPAPEPEGHNLNDRTTTDGIQGVWVKPDEEVHWTWTHYPGGCYVSGYTLKKVQGQDEHLQDPGTARPVE